MSEGIINKAHLQELTKEAQARIAKNAKKKLEEDALQAEIKVQEDVERWKKLLPSVLEGEAKTGKYFAHVMGDCIKTPTDKKVAEILAQYCEGLGLRTEMHHNKSEDSYILVVSWEETKGIDAKEFEEN